MQTYMIFFPILYFPIRLKNMDKWMDSVYKKKNQLETVDILCQEAKTRPTVNFNLEIDKACYLCSSI